MNQYTSIQDALSGAARNAPGRGVTMLDRRGLNPQLLTWRSLNDDAASIAGKLAATGVPQGGSLLLCLPTSADMLRIFLGCVVRGGLPTVLAPAGAFGGAAGHSSKLRHVVELLGSARVVCESHTREDLLRSGEDEIAALTITAEELFALDAPTGFTPPTDASPETVAFMQLTSGSTGRQRAVKIRHGNVLHNSRAIAGMTHHVPRADDSVALWLPLYHDMGLMSLFFAMTHDMGLSIMRPDTFLMRPRAWLQLMSKTCYAPAPNFAWQLCVERLAGEDFTGLDLSGLHSGMIGAEMIRAGTSREFTERFAPYGFDPRAFRPCYGLAEATLAATGDIKGEGVRTIAAPPGCAISSGDTELVCNGPAVLDTEIGIVPSSFSGDDGARPVFLPEETPGEIWVRGPGIFAGYHNDPAATAATLCDGWLRTGDIGFLKDRELYITGRIKDLLIIRGHNIMPHEIEWLAETESGGGGSGRCGAFSVPGHDGEQAVVVIECGGAVSDLKAIEHSVRSRVGKSLGILLADVVFLKRGAIPKTTSGKVRRNELRSLYLAAKLDRIQV